MTDTATPDSVVQPVKVFGRKRGHLTTSKEAWVQQTLEKYRLPPVWARSQILQGAGLDDTTARVCLEIGFGNGMFLAHLAKSYPNDLFIGADLFMEGVAGLLNRVESGGLGNVRLHVGPVQELLQGTLVEGCLNRVVINFPDPWPKKRHHKRRLIQPEFLSLLSSRMCTGASLELATDWSDYAQWMMTCLEKCPNLHNVAGPGHYAQPMNDWITTRFQEKGQAAGRPTWRLHFLKILCPDKKQSV
ncbi:MAG: tRNA (guanosine(46)-N7)-methyltransferase TrmB [Magnetococcales bacterium]|nr:tRNA (guanosine(46)-N7)-methyltransferase TrmB [Magnetococcales bacterium]NGZ26754.1 tRNA (guanosine(46)-N7)-methyltransferase TrmB [Magnetococcales bacterium]